MQTQQLIRLLRAPQSAEQLVEDDWNSIVLAGRQHQLLGALASALKISTAWATVPTAVKRHLHLELLTSQRRGESAVWELEVIRRTVSSEVNLVVLKGCAYLIAGDANRLGRIFSDMDVMVKRAELQQVETELMGGGWKPSKVDAYDDAYYRNWMHEVPPMEHVRRHTVLDLHHAINPPVADFYVNPVLLRANRVEISPGLFVLSPLDRVAHCAIHLIQEGETKKLLRDLYDLHLLLAQHCAGEQGHSALLVRSQELGIKPLVIAATAAASQLFEQKPGRRSSSWLQACLVNAAINAHEPRSIQGNMAGMLLLMYSHWIKMPLKILVPHLSRKAIKALFSRETGKQEAKNA